MSDSNRDQRDKTLEGFFCFAAVVGTAILIYAIGQNFGVSAGRDQVTAREHYEDTKQDNLRACVGREGGATIECVAEAIESAQDQSDSRQDLYAQRDMANFAFWLLVFTGLTFGVTGLGVFFVKRTLDATVEAVNKSVDATIAMVRANEIAENAQRPWIDIGVRLDSVEHPNENSITFDFEVTFTNTGQMLAESCNYMVKQIPMDRDYLAHMRGWIDKFELEDKPLDTVLVPGQTSGWATSAGHAIEVLPWEVREWYRKDCFLLVLVMASYEIPGDEVRRYAMRGFSIGEDKGLVDNRNLIYESIRSLHLGNSIIQPFGISRAN